MESNFLSYRQAILLGKWIPTEKMAPEYTEHGTLWSFFSGVDNQEIGAVWGPRRTGTDTLQWAS